jgi:hypothetical protein
MEEELDLAQSVQAINNVMIRTSWFGENAYRAPDAAKPILYAMACLEVVLENSEKAREIFDQIVKAWSEPGIHSVYEKIMSNVSDKEKEELQLTIKNAPDMFEQNPNEPFQNLGETLTQNDVTYEDIESYLESPEELQWLEDWETIALLILELVIVGFNREEDANKGIYKVVPSEESRWLILAIVYRGLFEHKQIPFDNNKSALEKMSAEGNANRKYRRLIARAKKIGMKLTNDKIYMNAARCWYQCRIVHTSIDKYIAAGAERYLLDRENLRKQILPCDRAVGYMSFQRNKMID